jgi:hypothetical protein
MNSKTKVRTWQRLTKKEAVNFLITELIVGGHDPKKELVIDGDPGPFLEKASRTLDIDWKKVWPQPGTTIKHPKQISGAKLRAEVEIREIAERIGYSGDNVIGIIAYLRSLPDKGPIG